MSEPGTTSTPSALQSPSQYLAELVASAQVVLLADHPGISNHLRLLGEAVPELAAAGCQNLAWEYTNTRQQDKLDQLVGADSWNPAVCAELFADLLGIGFAYQEYADVLHAVWQYNRDASSSKGGKPLRVIALGLPSYVEDPSLLDGRSAGELELRNWWLGGHYRDVCAYHAANVLTEQVLRKGERALVYADVRNTATRLVQWHDELATVTLGNLLHHWMGDGVRRVLFHGVVGDPAATERVEELVAASPESAKQGTEVTFGIDLARSTIGNVSLTKVAGVLDETTESLRLRNVADGYLFVSARENFEPVSLLEDLITDINFESVERRYRALVPRPQPYSRQELEEVRIEGLQQLTDDWPPLPEPDEEQPKRRFGFGRKPKP